MEVETKVKQKEKYLQKESFFSTVCKIALPVTLQSVLQSSFSVVDQIMTGSLGSTSIAGIGLAGKFSSLYSVLISAVGAVAGIMIAQYIGKKDSREVSRSFFMNLLLAVLVAGVFSGICGLFPSWIMQAYTKDIMTREIAAKYLRIIAISFLPIAVNTLLSTLMRCMNGAVMPLYASFASVVMNTCLNYVLIYGKFGFPRMGVAGAAWASVISQVFCCILMIMLFFVLYKKQDIQLKFLFKLNANGRKQYLGILLPILVCEFLWSLGENVYAAIYGHIGTNDCAAMTLTNPVQALFIGALSGLSQAAGILIGRTLGSEDYDRAYKESKKLLYYGVGGSLLLSLVLIFGRSAYMQIYNVDTEVKNITMQILFAFAIIAPVKVLNMILGGGIIRSGGKTKYIMWIDIIGTWGFGVPLGLLSAFALELSIPYVYFILSLEECVRLVISLVVFRRKRWMRSLEKQGDEPLEAAAG